MSDRDFLDLDDDLLDGGSDAPVGEWDDDLLDDFPADDPASRGDASAPPPAAKSVEAKPVAAEDLTVETPATAPPKKARRARRSGRHGGTGVLCFALVLLAGLTLASGLLTATGAAPEALLDFSGFQDITSIGDFAAHPINAFWLAAAVTLAAALAAGIAMDRRLRRLSRMLADQDVVLEAVHALDPENAETWRCDALQADPDLAATTSNVLGHLSLQQAKLTRYVGLEGELHRLERAMGDDHREGLSGNWDNPAAGSLADQALRLMDVRDAAVDDSSQQQQVLEERGPDLTVGLRDARGWQSSAVEQVNAQGAAAERLSRQLSRVEASLPGGDDQQVRRDRLRQALSAVRDELASLPARGAEQARGGGDMSALVERASRLAFQIAMEVARLGAKGERLLPLTQDLEELTTELRGLQSPDPAQAGHGDARDRALDKVRGRLAELDPEVLETGDAGDLSAAVRDMAPAAAEIAAGLVQLSQGFGAQGERLAQLAAAAADITGIDAESAFVSQPDGGGMRVDRFDPFGDSAEPEGGLVADPFASSGVSIFDTPADNEVGEFARTALPGQEDTLVSENDPFGLSTAEPTTIPETEELLVDGPLPSESEKVYDLAEFDAQLLPPEHGAEPQQEPIHELSEFDAVRIE